MYTIINKKGLLYLAVSLIMIFANIIIFANVVLIATSDTKLLPIYSVGITEKKIAVTFDVAWGNSNTDELLTILDKYNAKATFFITGDWCDRFSGDVAHFYEKGHSIQNHSDKHPHPIKISAEKLLADTKLCDEKITAITGTQPKYYRAPYGEYNNMVIETLPHKVIQWDVDSRDWQKPSSDDIIKNVTNNTKSGSILLFHNDLSNTTMALDKILSILNERGFTFVTVDDLLIKDNFYINRQGVQISK